MSNLTYNPESFALEVERRVSSKEEPSYICATSDLIEEMDCEVEEVKHMISPTLVAKIKVEASRRGMLKEKDTTLDISSFFK
jgi:hypothetical protein